MHEEQREPAHALVNKCDGRPRRVGPMYRETVRGQIVFARR
jgi:hypothetical protein